MEEKNNFYYRPAYKCGICGSEFASVQERMNCEMACVKKQIEEEKKATELKKKEEQKARKAEVDEAFKNLQRLFAEYVKDYGHYEYCDEDENCYWPSRVWHRFW